MQTPVDTVRVHIEAPERVNLEMRDGRDWVIVCASPCDAAVPTHREYRIDAPGISSSRTFEIESGTSVTLKVDPAPGKGGPIAVTVIGVVGLAPGFVVTVGVVAGALVGVIFVCPFVAAFSSQNNQSSAYGGCVGDAAGYFAKGYTSPFVWAPAIVGGVALVGGIVWLATSSPTTVKQTAAASAAAIPDHWRVPVWTQAELPVPPAPLFPLLDVRF